MHHVTGTFNLWIGWHFFRNSDLHHWDYLFPAAIGLRTLFLSISGEPEVDYPIFAEAPETSFTCDDKSDGMYADVEARCQVWHQCFAGRTWAFLCPNGTIFNQEIFTCVWWFDFDCSTAEGLYGKNDDLYPPEGEGGNNDDGGDTYDDGLGEYLDYDIGQAVEYDVNANYDDEPPTPAASEPAPQVTPGSPAPVSPAQTTPAPYPDYQNEPVQPSYEEELPPEPAQPIDYSPDYSSDYVPSPATDPLDYTDDNLAEPQQPAEEGYNYPVPENPLELPERPQDTDYDSAAEANNVPDDSVAPLALYGAPADPYQPPIDSLPTEASAPVEEELPLAQYLPPSGEREGRQGRKFRRGRKRGGRRRKLGRRVRNIIFKQ